MERIITTGNDYRPDPGSVGLGVSCHLRRRPAGRKVWVVLMIYQGDCLDILPTLDAESVDSIVTDPPYGISFMGKKWDYDVPSVDIWKECLRVLKPGGYLLSFAGTRTQHRMAVNIEDAGFEIRDMIAWVYGSGFPKSLNIGKVMDKYLKTGNASWNGTGDSSNGALGYSKLQHNQGYRPADYSNKHQNKEEITEDLAKKWEGWGTALKPALEPITVARKPLGEKTVAENCLKWGTGGINIDGCRVKIGDEKIPRLNIAYERKGDNNFGGGKDKRQGTITGDESSGRFPANLIHDGSQEVLELFPMTKSGSIKAGRPNGTSFSIGGELGKRISKYDTQGDSGSAARFFYCAKASKQDRDEGCEEIVAKTWKDQGFRDNETTHLSPRAGAGRTSLLRNNHPTVKPTSLMRYLCRLVTPPGGTILDPFMGSGSTGKAAALEGFRFIGIELEKEYTAIAEKRIMSAQPLFAGVNT